MGRENGATETDDTSLLQTLTDLLGLQRLVIKRFAGDPFILAVRLDDDTQRIKAGGVRLGMHRHFQYGAGRRGMDGG